MFLPKETGLKDQSAFFFLTLCEDIYLCSEINLNVIIFDF